MVAAYEEGGEECVAQTMRLLTRVPSDWWNVRGCKNWLLVAFKEMETQPEKFFEKIKTYSSSKEYRAGQPFENQIEKVPCDQCDGDGFDSENEPCLACGTDGMV